MNYNFAKQEAGVDNLDWFQFSEGILSGAAEVSARRTENGMVEIVWQEGKRFDIRNLHSAFQIQKV